MSKQLLIVDDDPNIRALLKLVLVREGYQVAEAHDGVEAIKVLKASSIAMAIIDVMMPRLDGLELCGHIRQNYDIPIIMLTAREQLTDKEQGYLRGTDDYMTKPFEPMELIFRIKALFRRYSRVSADVIHLNRIAIDNKNHEIAIGDEMLLLPLKEFELLAQLAQYPGRLFAREELISLVWAADYVGDNRTVDVHIKRLRERFADYRQDFTIQTVRGIGYKLEVTKP